MKRMIFVVLIIMASISLFAGRSATPHPVYIELHNSMGNIPTADSLEVKCWLDNNPDDVLDMSNSNLIFPIKDVFLQIQCSGFNSWSAGDILHVDILDKQSNEYLKLELELTYENFQLFSDNHLEKRKEDQ